jgi:hypothetical protein
MSKKFDWNKVKRICDRCCKEILNDHSINQYKKIPDFFRDNYCVFCRCQSNGLREIDLIEMNDYYIMNYKLKH